MKLFAFILSKTWERKVWLFKSLEFEILLRNLYADCRRDSLRESNLEISEEQLSGNLHIKLIRKAKRAVLVKKLKSMELGAVVVDEWSMWPRVDGIPGIAPLHLQTLFDPNHLKLLQILSALPSKLLQIQIPLASPQSVPTCIEQDTLLGAFKSNLNDPGSAVPYSLLFRAMASWIRMRPTECLWDFLGQ